MIRAVVLDLDGTLVNFNIDYKTLRAEVRSFLITQGIPASILSLNDSIFEMLNKTEIFMKNNGKSTQAFKEVYAKVNNITEKYELEAAKTVSLLPGVTDVLKALKEEGLKVGLCTVSSEKTTNYILGKFKIGKFFDAVIPREKVKHAKPHAEHLETTLKALGAKPEETVMIGDSIVDVKCARELKVIAVGVTSGVSNSKELADAGANYIITLISDLPTLIEQINRT
ncbi:MAG: HAD family hydrolase [Nitrososphaerota archaeon]|nr:HAD family hydrolase [Candidatus Bathyarchaeota archaeon]MDW8023383.1 HAD family hydrolase [Nitrososphaerota archaeon]